MDTKLASYVVRYYSRFMSREEGLAWNLLCRTVKATGADDVAAQREARTKFPGNKWLSDDPEALRLASHGTQWFVVQVARRILAEQGDQVFINCCPRCGELARTPKARQCRVCKNDWHDANGLSGSSFPRLTKNVARLWRKLWKIENKEVGAEK